MAVLVCWGAQGIGYWTGEIYANERARSDERIERSRRPLFSSITPEMRQQIIERAAAIHRANEKGMEEANLAESE